MTRHKVVIVNADRSVYVDGDETLLDAALAAGVDYPHGCKSGRCGSCKSRLVDGLFSLREHTRFALSEEEKVAGLILAAELSQRAI